VGEGGRIVRRATVNSTGPNSERFEARFLPFRRGLEEHSQGRDSERILWAALDPRPERARAAGLPRQEGAAAGPAAHGVPHPQQHRNCNPIIP